MTTDGRPSNHSALLRFLVAGGSNTAISLVLFALVARVVSPWLAYTVVFALGLTYTTLLTGWFVFGAQNTWHSSGLFVGWYVAVCTVGLSVLQTLQARGVDSPDLLAVLTVVVSAPAELSWRSIDPPCPLVEL